MLEAYTAIRDTFELGGDDVAAIAHALNTALRQQKPERKEKRIPPQFNTLADVLVSDICIHKLPPSYKAHLHLLSYFREARQFDRGARFWQWLVAQDDTYVNPAVYGVAIELLAVQGSPAAETEDLFSRALQRFPGSFNEYHLSPAAVLPDRTQPVNITGIPMTLLQGIITARLLQGSSRDAYLALDTALRLYPTQVPSRFFTVFVEERPVIEAYKVFLMACRSGTTLGPDGLKLLLSKMRTVVANAPIANASVLRAMLTASYAYLASGGSVTTNHLTELVIGTTTLLQDKSLAQLNPEDLRPVTDQLLAAVKRLFDIWKMQGVSPGIAAFNSIISNIGGKGGRKDVITTCLADIQALGLQPNAVTRRSLLTAAGGIGDVELVKTAWIDLLSFRQSTDTALDLGDWQTLAKAARKIKCEDLVRQQLSSLADLVNPAVASRIHGLLNEKATTRDVGVSTSPITESAPQISNRLLEDVEDMQDRLGKNLLPAFYLHPLALSLGASAAGGSAFDRELRSIYDEMTSGVTSPVVSQNEYHPDAQSDVDRSTADPLSESMKPPAMSSTGLPLDELRYQNWRSINDLLGEAERHDSEYILAIDRAIADGTAPPKRDLGSQAFDKGLPSVGLSNLGSRPVTSAEHKLSEGEAQVSQSTLDELHTTIRRLRGR